MQAAQNAAQLKDAALSDLLGIWEMLNESQRADLLAVAQGLAGSGPQQPSTGKAADWPSSGGGGTGW